MARIFISGSADGLGFLAGQWLLERGHLVTFHARSESRAEALRRRLKQESQIVIGDVSTIAAMRDVADQVNRIGRHDAVIHNVAIGYQEPKRMETEDGLSQLFAINTLAPYLLTTLIERPERLVYLSSGLHRSGDPGLDDLQWKDRHWNGSQAYSDSKLHNCWLAFAVARRWDEVMSNALEPGWVATKMGGPGAPDDLAKGAETQAWLAVSDDIPAQATGEYFFHQKRKAVSANARREDLQDALMDYCKDLTGVEIAP
ncbi:MAG TPA: SDR family NAD(P)-dependent oxidoreductase [Rhizomicrobium sp.]|jgi:NAD(P)-dependent dehydrogenase (short-subunit alcohol dehydrogenase family)